MKNNLFFEITVFILVSILPFVIISNTIISGNIDFGYDTARDFISGLNNIEKLTLVGPTSGIPGVFYGPYWIWLLSLGLFFYKDPRIVVFIILTIPYFIIFPFGLFRFKKIFGFTNCLLLWLIFIMGTGMKYAVSAWNPHPAPLLFLLLMGLLIFTDFTTKNYTTYFKMLLVGIVSGLIINFHISFGLGVMFGIILYYMIGFIKSYVKSKKFIFTLKAYLNRVGIFGIGLFMAFLPLLVFEFRHGFNQFKTAINVVLASGSVVSVSGLSDFQIVQSFFGKLSDLLKIPSGYMYMFLGLGIGYLLYLIKKKKIKLTNLEIQLFLLLSSTSFAILFLYLTSKNPVWSYHFIGVEIIFLLATGILISKIRYGNLLLGAWLLLTLSLNSVNIVKEFYQNPYRNSSALATHRHIVEEIIVDAGISEFKVYAYSPAIYTYEYTYLFKWLSGKDIPYDPNIPSDKSDLVYLIIPSSTQAVEQNFINSKTPEKIYNTSKKWKMPDGTKIFKRKLNIDLQAYYMYK